MRNFLVLRRVVLERVLSSELICMTMDRALIMHRDANGTSHSAFPWEKDLPLRRRPLPPPPPPPPPSFLPSLFFSSPPPPSHSGKPPSLTQGNIPWGPAVFVGRKGCCEVEGMLFKTSPDPRFSLPPLRQEGGVSVRP